jgi:hypothetical protein
LPDFSWHNTPIWEKYTKSPQHYKMAVKYNIPTFFILRPYKINPNWDFWSENIPSGNPVWNLNDGTFRGRKADFFWSDFFIRYQSSFLPGVTFRSFKGFNIRVLLPQC